MALCGCFGGARRSRSSHDYLQAGASAPTPDSVRGVSRAAGAEGAKSGGDGQPASANAVGLPSRALHGDDAGIKRPSAQGGASPSTEPSGLRVRTLLATSAELRNIHKGPGLPVQLGTEEWSIADAHKTTQHGSPPEAPGPVSSRGHAPSPLQLKPDLTDLLFIGQGASGLVYKAPASSLLGGATDVLASGDCTHVHGTLAVKFMICNTPQQLWQRAKEALVSKLVTHPNLVRTLALDVTVVTAATYQEFGAAQRYVPACSLLPGCPTSLQGSANGTGTGTGIGIGIALLSGATDASASNGLAACTTEHTGIGSVASTLAQSQRSLQHIFEPSTPAAAAYDHALQPAPGATRPGRSVAAPVASSVLVDSGGGSGGKAGAAALPAPANPGVERLRGATSAALASSAPSAAGGPTTAAEAEALARPAGSGDRSRHAMSDPRPHRTLLPVLGPPRPLQHRMGGSTHAGCPCTARTDDSGVGGASWACASASSASNLCSSSRARSGSSTWVAACAGPGRGRSGDKDRACCLEAAGAAGQGAGGGPASPAPDSMALAAAVAVSAASSGVQLSPDMRAQVAAAMVASRRAAGSGGGGGGSSILSGPAAASPPQAYALGGGGGGVRDAPSAALSPHLYPDPTEGLFAAEPAADAGGRPARRASHFASDPRGGAGGGGISASCSDRRHGGGASGRGGGGGGAVQQGRALSAAGTCAGAYTHVFPHATGAAAPHASLWGTGGTGGTGGGGGGGGSLLPSCAVSPMLLGSPCPPCSTPGGASDLAHASAAPSPAPPAMGLTALSGGGAGANMLMRDSGGAEPVPYQDILYHLDAMPGRFLARVIMEYCDGGTLLSRIACGDFSTQPDRPGAPMAVLHALRAVLWCAAEVAAGMAHLHSLNIIHGDLKPGNVLLASDAASPLGYVCKVSDFGLATALEASEQTISHENWGTLVFMAPESCAGRCRKASDVYSFGVLLWQMCTGQRPYAGLKAGQVLLGVKNGSLRLQWPAWVNKSVAKVGAACMRFDPKERPSFKGVLSALAKIAARLDQKITALEACPAGTPLPALLPQQLLLLQQADEGESSGQHAVAAGGSGAGGGGGGDAAGAQDGSGSSIMGSGSGGAGSVFAAALANAQAGAPAALRSGLALSLAEEPEGEGEEGDATTGGERG